MIVSHADIVEAAATIGGKAVRTPLMSSDRLDAITGGRVFLKAEPLQITGSFKFRGAFNRLSRLTGAEKQAGVVAMSSGNHAQGVATAARMLGLPACIVMPSDSPRLKMRRTREAGAEIVVYDRVSEDRVAIAQRIAGERGATIVPPYDDPLIMAGQGTVALEIAEDLAARGLRLDCMLTGVSGGGLLAGTAVAIAEKMQGARIYSVEPEGFDDHARSFAAGAIVANAHKAGSLCDGLMADRPGALTFPINKELCTGGLVVSEEEVKAAMRFAFEELKLVVEPSGAVSLAALLHGKVDVRGKVAAAILTGGNVDGDLFAAIVRG